MTGEWCGGDGGQYDLEGDPHFAFRVKTYDGFTGGKCCDDQS